MIPYMVGKFAPNLSHLTRGLVKYVPGRGHFRAVPSQIGDKYVTSPPPPPIVELVDLVCTANRLSLTFSTRLALFLFLFVGVYPTFLFFFPLC